LIFVLVVITTLMALVSVVAIRTVLAKTAPTTVGSMPE
jgi:hypothetical protein